VDTQDDPNRFMSGPYMTEPIALQEGEAFCWALSLRLTARRSARAERIRPKPVCGQPQSFGS
jgi:hypothetical protein